jgi:hypothetical protein
MSDSVKVMSTLILLVWFGLAESDTAVTWKVFMWCSHG